MRVIAGKCRRLQLDTIKGDKTRPTTDRIKETLFNIINNELYNVDFLDLFAGSGQIGIEALSRGAASCVFVDNNRKAIECINSNISKCKLEASAKVICDNVIAALKRLNGQEFDIIFMDPPYNKGFEKEILEFLAENSLCKEDCLIIIEADISTDFDYVEDLGFVVVQDKQYKTSRHLFIRKG